MASIPSTETAILLRTDFSDEAGWQSLIAAAEGASEPFMFTMQNIDDPAFAGMGIADILAAIGADYPHSCIAIADSAAMKSPIHPVAVVDLVENRGAEFRCAAAHLASVDNNLSIGNMGFSEFAANVGSSGIFQGFQF